MNENECAWRIVKYNPKSKEQDVSRDETDLSLALIGPQLDKFFGLSWPTVDIPVIHHNNDSTVQLNILFGLISA